ncbi:uncharacterized protein LOC123412866 isoform X3 [Hordeum vulgare subsp. vulgare]|uniref:uncharacterized protein LOC123412791 isoform X2 n=1 Tax=Hordeum vulgare subsp. vulgare TaxID=112509 RepID=UPI001D1A597E|nr:uncharacterized protein LOC123412791 isoform X2 [Hordeum vulgare subsp. vulgare]XP_044961669.1 uncharacterized protein LOC123412794 isoform X2 [Hordeum vulgare subsp. vulgare]XP_044961747.1 uncharacterized protein LOC123412864 isoform X2 [Hordeum vulgare subsp. vulgare]XP_044961754.1 uncharacterized protein LOC123412866 isoform X3 [Hordeum vulgare subsp. vulgare]
MLERAPVPAPARLVQHAPSAPAVLTEVSLHAGRRISARWPPPPHLCPLASHVSFQSGEGIQGPGAQEQRARHARRHLPLQGHQAELPWCGEELMYKYLLGRDLLRYHINSHLQINQVVFFCRLMEGTSSKAIVILATGDCLGVALGNGDMSWKDFLSRAAGRRAKSYTMDTIFSHKMWS